LYAQNWLKIKIYLFS